MTKKKLEKEIEKIVIKSLIDKTHISYWDGCTVELMELFEKELSSQQKELRKKLFKSALELDEHNSEALFNGCKDMLKPDAYIKIMEVWAIAFSNKKQL